MSTQAEERAGTTGRTGDRRRALIAATTHKMLLGIRARSEFAHDQRLRRTSA